MKWFLLAVVGFAGFALLCAHTNGGASGAGMNPAFGTAYAADPAYGANINNAYGIGMYGGFNDSNMAPRGWWRPNMLGGDQ